MKSGMTKFYDEQIAPLANVPTTDEYAPCSWCDKIYLETMMLHPMDSKEVFCSNDCYANWFDAEVNLSTEEVTYEELEDEYWQSRVDELRGK